jgi:hypothetical protein
MATGKAVRTLIGCPLPTKQSLSGIRKRRHMTAEALSKLERLPGPSRYTVHGRFGRGRKGDCPGVPLNSGSVAWRFFVRLVGTAMGCIALVAHGT